MRQRLAVAFLALGFVLSACAGGTPSLSPSTRPTTAPPASAGPGASALPGPLHAAKPEDCPAPPGDVEITYWSATEAQGEAVERAMIQEYMAANPHVRITYTGGLSQADSNTKFITDAAAGGGPTIMGTDMASVRVFIENNLLSPAVPSAMCAASHQDIIDRYVSGTIDTYIFDGEVFGLPTQQNSWSFFVNNRKFTEAGLSLATDIPETWEEVAALQERFKKVDANGRITQKGFEYRYIAIQWYINMATLMMRNLEGEFFDADGKPIWNSDKGLQIVNTWKLNVIDPSATTNVSNSPYNDFASEQDVMSFGGPNAIAFVEELNPEMAGNITVAPMPKAGPGPNFLYGYPSVVNANASDAEKAAAWNFMNYMYSDPNRWFAATGLLQPLKDWYLLPAATEFLGLDVFIADMTKALPLASTPNYGALREAWKNLLDRVVLENQDPQASLDQSIQEYLNSVGQ